jgi:hypothetical protein
MVTCAGCAAARFCNAACAASGWPRHKKRCACERVVPREALWAVVDGEWEAAPPGDRLFPGTCEGGLHGDVCFTTEALAQAFLAREVAKRERESEEQRAESKAYAAAEAAKELGAAAPPRDAAAEAAADAENEADDRRQARGSLEVAFFAFKNAANLKKAWSLATAADGCDMYRGLYATKGAATAAFKSDSKYLSDQFGDGGEDGEGEGEDMMEHEIKEVAVLSELPVD